MDIHLHPKINWRVAEFCQAFGIGRTKFYALVKAGHIQITKCGRRTLISCAEAERFQDLLEAGHVN